MKLRTLLFASWTSSLLCINSTSVCSSSLIDSYWGNRLLPGALVTGVSNGGGGLSVLKDSRANLRFFRGVTKSTEPRQSVSLSIEYAFPLYLDITEVLNYQLINYNYLYGAVTRPATRLPHKQLTSTISRKKYTNFKSSLTLQWRGA